jgi:hypothetical protein
MSRHNEPGKIVIGTGANQQVVQPAGGNVQSKFLTNKPSKKTTKTKTKKDDSDTKKGKQTFKSKFLYGGSEGVDESVDKKDYDNPRKHKLRNQFDYLTDKYYGGDQEAFAKTSQGQVLLGYLQNVDATRGGGRGGDIDTLEKINQAYDEGKISEEDFKTIRQAVGGGIEAIRNLPMNVLRNQPELNRTGILTSPEYFRFSQLLQSQNPMEYNKARPFSSGALPKTIFDLVARPVTAIGGGIMDSLDSLGVINRTEKEKPKPLGSSDFLPQSLFENLPTQITDQGGMNDVAQFMIDNQAPVEVPGEEEDEFDTAQFDPDSVLPGFGIDVRGLPLAPGGGVTEVLPGFSLQDTIRLLGDRGIFSTV